MAAEDYFDRDDFDEIDYDDVGQDPLMNRPYHRNNVLSSRKKGVMRTPETNRKEWNGQPVSRMDSDHIMNAIIWCEKKFVAAREAHFKCHERINEFYFKSVYDMYPDYKNLREEWDRRNS